MLNVTYLCMCVHMFDVCICVYVCMCVCVYVCMCVCVYVYMYVHGFVFVYSLLRLLAQGVVCDVTIHDLVIRLNRESSC